MQKALMQTNMHEDLSSSCLHSIILELQSEKTNNVYSDTNQAVQPLEMARGLKFCSKEVAVLYHPSSEADLCLCFRICKTLVFSQQGSYRSTMYASSQN